jgi:tetratricopeptide (TPR) repeat protein
VQELRALLAPALADRYAIERGIGSGGAAIVYLARDLKHGRQVALKVLRTDVGASLGADRFLREIHIAAGLNHPHILAVHDSGEAAGLLYYVMPFVEGESLRDRLKREGALPLDDSLRIAREVADALAYAHSQGVVHRDVKPGNILLVGGHAVVADFGIAMATGGDTDTLAELGVPIGTPNYMSPEQGGGRGPVDGRSDLYSLGCVLYEMLTGKLPFDGASPQAVMARHATEPAPAVRATRPSVPVPVDAAVRRALAKLPADRFATVHQFAEALGRAEAARPSLARRRPVATLTVAVLLLAVAIGAATRLRRQPVETGLADVGVLVVPLMSPDSTGGSQLPPRSALNLLSSAIDWLPGVHTIDGLALADSMGRLPSRQLIARAQKQDARYVLAGSLAPEGEGRVARVDLYAVGSGERIVRSQAPISGDGDAAALGRAAMAAARGLAEEQHMSLGSRAMLFDATGSAIALGYLLEGQDRFWRAQFDAAASAFRAAIEADSSCALAYHRLSVAHVWRHDYAAALAATASGLSQSSSIAPRWRALLDAQRLYVLSEGDSATAAFQTIVADDPNNADAWLGLAESLFHFAMTTGHRPTDARPAFNRLVALDSMFAPIYDHLADLALRAGQLNQAAQFLQRIPADDPGRPARSAAIALQRTSGTDRLHLLDSLAFADRYALSDLIALLVRDSNRVALADTIATILGGPNRTPDDRRRAADYHLAALARMDRWPEAVNKWKTDGTRSPLDGWMILAGFAGFPADSFTAPMFAWARAAVLSGRAPDFSLPLTHDYQQAFQALAYRATLQGDSAEVAWLLDRLDSVPPSADSSDGLRETLVNSLRGRLALLAHDTTQAISLLQRSVVRIPERAVTFLPFPGMAPQRFLLAELAARRQNTGDARRWLSSLTDSWAVPDIIYAPAARRLGAELHP